MAHFLQHSTSPPVGPISPKFGQFLDAISYKGAIFWRQMKIDQDPPRNVGGILGNLTFLTIPILGDNRELNGPFPATSQAPS